MSNDVRLRRAEENTPQLQAISHKDVQEVVEDLRGDFLGTINRKKRTFKSILFDDLDGRKE